MEKEIKLTCEHCKKEYQYSRLTLSKYWGKKIAIKCKHCQARNVVTIDQEFMTGVKKPQKTDDFTLILGGQVPSVNDYKLGKLQVLQSQYSENQILNLKIGDNVIGRKANSDISDSNKVGISTNDTTISRSHCLITVLKMDDGMYKYILSDLGSANGTFYFYDGNEKRLDREEKIYIELGNDIGLGHRSKVKIIIE